MKVLIFFYEMKLSDFIDFGDNFCCDNFMFCFEYGNLKLFRFYTNKNSESFFTKNMMIYIDSIIDEALADYDEKSIKSMIIYLNSNKTRVMIISAALSLMGFSVSRQYLDSLKDYDPLDFSIKKADTFDQTKKIDYDNNAANESVTMTCSPFSNYYLNFVRNKRQSLKIFENAIVTDEKRYLDNYDLLLKKYCLSKKNDKSIQIVNEDKNFVTINFGNKSFSYQDYLTLFHNRSCKKIIFDTESPTKKVVEPIFHQDVKDMIDF